MFLVPNKYTFLLIFSVAFQLQWHILNNEPLLLQPSSSILIFVHHTHEFYPHERQFSLQLL